MLFNECVQSGGLTYEVNQIMCLSAEALPQNVGFLTIYWVTHWQNLTVFGYIQGDSDPQMHIRLIKKIKASSQGLFPCMSYTNCFFKFPKAQVRFIIC